jgi:endonuclease G
MKKYLIGLLVFLSLSLNVKAQLPRLINLNDQIVKRNGFILSYNESHEQANWVFYKLTPEDVKCDNAKRKNYFKVDYNISTESATLTDYKGSGYDRGHLKPAADATCSQELMNETFLMSNMSPQHPSLNRGMWKTLEGYVRTLAEGCDSIYVYTGGVLKDDLKKIGDGVSVPQTFYKVIYEFKDGKMTTLCFLLPNKKVEGVLFMYKVTLGEVEKITNIDFPFN